MPVIFQSKAPKIISDLMRDVAVTKIQAGAVTGNIGHECCGFLLMQEVRPRAGKGGYGWCQWTGPRRTSFFEFCAANHLSVDSDEGNYAYLLHELRTTQTAALLQLKRHNDLTACVTIFEQYFERAGVPNIPDRVRYAQIAIDAFNKAHPQAQAVSS